MRLPAVFASFSLSKMGFHNIFPDLPDICLNQPERILSTVPVASLISMGCVDARSNQSMAHVMACFQGSFNIRAVMWIHVHGIADSMLLGQLHQAAQDIVVIGSAAVLCTDGYLTLRTLKALSHAAHVHGPGFGYALRNRGRTAVPHFLIDGKVGIHFSIEVRHDQSLRAL